MVDINSLLYNSHVSRDISDVLLVPIIKDRVKSPWENSHYRLIVIATDFPKNLEKIIVSRLVVTCKRASVNRV